MQTAARAVRLALNVTSRRNENDARTRRDLRHTSGFYLPRVSARVVHGCSTNDVLRRISQCQRQQAHEPGKHEHAGDVVIKVRYLPFIIAFVVDAKCYMFGQSRNLWEHATCSLLQTGCTRLYNILCFYSSVVVGTRAY